MVFQSVILNYYNGRQLQKDNCVSIIAVFHERIREPELCLISFPSPSRCIWNNGLYCLLSQCLSPLQPLLGGRSNIGTNSATQQAFALRQAICAVVWYLL
ncbi:hypothetical protein XELAEV_18039597mg [Xenopus laevis]|uniref:Uncharacterized protein n=1 Tax=Xenopus laevis TaxID=8355 RepID=A0A974H834_XENLA|nr:hypothetical protein XELAEV_18039597mg [Xenopus laevis]